MEIARLLELGLVLAVIGDFKCGNVARRYYGDAQSIAHHWEQPFCYCLAAELDD